MKLSELSKDERSLLIYLEAHAVDFGGKVASRHMNKEDFEITKQWNNKAFIAFGRIGLDYITAGFTNWVILSPLAWELAHQERKNRFKRIYSKRTWKKTSEL